MTSVADLLNQRHQILAGHITHGMNSFRDAENAAKCEQIENKIIDMLVKAGMPEYVGYDRHGTTYVVQVDYHFRTVEWVEFLTSEAVDTKVNRAVIETPEWLVATN